MVEKVLVLAAGAQPDPPALRRAVEVAGAGGEIAVFDVVYEPMLEAYLGNREIYEPLRRRVLDERRAQVEAMAKAVAARGLQASANAVWAHPLHEAVAKEIAAQAAGLLVAGPKLQSHGAGLAHSDWQLVVACPVPALIVKSAAEVPYRNIVAAVDPFHTHAKPAELDSLILRQARALQQVTGAALTVLHSYVPLSYFGADLAAPAATDARFEDGRRQALDGLLREAGIAPDAARVVAGEPHVVLESLAARGEADLIIMGVLARSRLKELLIGNTAERVLHHGTADVMVVKPPIH
jgi:universal stress protein E